MRRTLTVMALTLFSFSAFAAAPGLERGAVPGGARHTPDSWVERVSVAEAATYVSGDSAMDALQMAARPIVLLETNYYTFMPGEPLQLRLTVHPNGYAGAVTMYLYREDRTSGERRYYNVGAGALLPAGEQADLFGSSAQAQPIRVPTFEDFVLFGSVVNSELSWEVSGALGGSITVPAGQTGLYQWVVEVRDAAGQRILSRSNAMFSYIEESIQVSGSITSSTTWTADNRYVLNDFVSVAAPATLEIEPGTVIYGGTSRASLFITRGARIIADGTARRPIIFTSAQRTGERAQRDWGSLIVLGRAPINEQGGQGFLEGLPAQSQYAFGGNDAGDDSGVLRFLRLEFGGFEIEANQEINGLTLAGVGNGTTIEYVEVLHNKDDAFEFFGGTVDARYLLAVANADDVVDWDLGYQGRIQFVAGIKRGVTDENDGNIIEADGHPQNFGLTPKSDPRVFNLTGYGTGRSDVGAYGAVFRRGTAGQIHNMILVDNRRAPVTVRDDATFANAASGEFLISNSILSGSFDDAAFASSSDRAAATRTFLFESMNGNRNVNPMLAIGAPSHIRTLMPDLAPLPGSPALDARFVSNPPDDGFFEAVDFSGAVDPGRNWILSGWASFSDN